MAGDDPQAGKDQDPGQAPTSTDAPPAGSEGGQPAADPQAAGSVDELPEWAQTLVGDLRKENAAHRKKAKSAEQAAQEAEEARLAEERKWQELAEKRAKERDKALAQLEAEKLARMRQEVAQAAGLPVEMAERLQGETREKLEADAKKLKDLMPESPSTPGAPTGPRRGAPKTPAPDDLVDKKKASGRYARF